MPHFADIHGPFANLDPSSDSGFIGRKKELSKLRKLFGRGQRVVLIVRPPGSGKTTLATNFADVHRSLFPGGLFGCT